jgi:hypothetical protein
LPALLRLPHSLACPNQLRSFGGYAVTDGRVDSRLPASQEQYERLERFRVKHFPIQK